jgi:hypothetical protein
MLASAGAGYLAGESQGVGWGVDRLQLETQGNLSSRIETLSRLRTGDSDGAIEILEKSADAATLTLPMGRTFEELPDGSKRVLMMTKLYRSAFPSESPVVRDVLGPVPPLPPDHEFCSDAMRQVAAMSAEREGP